MFCFKAITKRKPFEWVASSSLLFILEFIWHHCRYSSSFYECIAHSVSKRAFLPGDQPHHSTPTTTCSLSFLSAHLHKHAPTPPLPTSLRPFKYFSGREEQQCLTRYTVKLTGASTDNDRDPWAAAAAAAAAPLPPRRRSAATRRCREAVFYSGCGNRLGLHLSGRWWPDVRRKVNIADKYLDITGKKIKRAKTLEFFKCKEMYFKKLNFIRSLLRLFC